MPGARAVALLRGINVGRAKRVAMSDLRALMTGLGYGDVRTLLNSGNVVFSGVERSVRTAADRIGSALLEQLGVRSRVIVLTVEEVRQIVADNTLSIADNPSRLLVGVPCTPADLAPLRTLTRQDWRPEALLLGRRAVYLWCPDGVLSSRLVEPALQLLGDRVTTRNWATLVKVQAALDRP